MVHQVRRVPMSYHADAMHTNTTNLIATSRRRRSLPEPRVRKALRQAAGLTEVEVGRAIGVTASTVSRWETGRRSPRGTVRDAYTELLEALAKETVQ
jgi:DNA-binding transcriptional regulator YiaG